MPAEQRDYVRRVRQAPTAREKIAIYAAAMAGIGVRMRRCTAPDRGRGHDADCAALRAEIMRTPRGEHAAVRGRPARHRRTARGPHDDEVADIVWSMNSPEYQVLLVGERGWTAGALRDLAGRRLDPAAARALSSGRPERSRSA